MKPRKSQHLETRIQQLLAQILLRDVDDARLRAVTFTGVKLSPDKSHATVRFCSYLPDADPEALEEGLNKASGFFGQGMIHALAVRRTPRLHFVYDRGFDHAQRVDDLLNQARGKSGETDEP
ncbi:MAG: 30S ribosome-binding factor RbfA [Deltaproteobacteria bacterium]|nr:30S ribosome-binding factor RbfA [Deltaproteobacteria bacterium]